MIKCNSTVILNFGCSRSIFRIIHGRIYVQDSRNTVCTGHRCVQGDDKGSKFDQFYDHLCHVVVKSNNFTLLHVSEINLNTRSLNQNDSCDVDQHIGSRI